MVVRFPEGARQDIPALEQLLVPTPAGQRVPLAQIASVKVVEGPMQISRENGMRRVVVEANVRGRDLGGFVAAVQHRLAGLSGELPAGYFVEYGGQFENQQLTMRQLAIVVPIVLLLILFVLYSALGSARNALIVLLNLPFALGGGVVAAVAFRMTLSVSAAVAFIVLLGIAVQNGVVLVAFFTQLRERGLAAGEAVAEGCLLRFKPLVMTALVSFIGHLPMVYATGSGVPVNHAEAVRWYRAAAEKGDAEAAYLLAVMIDYGVGTPANPPEAVRWLRMAAEKGHARAQRQLADMLAQGRGAAKDDAEASRWYLAAAEQGDAAAQGFRAWTSSGVTA